jgi:hypothetical protein
MLKIGYKNIKLGRLRFDEGGIKKPQNAAAARGVDDGRRQPAAL